MTKTARDVVYKAMRRIKYISPEETPDATDYNEALQEYQGFHEWLLKEFPRQIHWNNDSVPEEYWVHIAGWFSGQLMETLDVPSSQKGSFEQNSSKAELRLREMLSRKTLKPVQGMYY